MTEFAKPPLMWPGDVVRRQRVSDLGRLLAPKGD